MAIHAKVTASLVAGAITGLLVAEAKRRGLPIEADEAADITVLLSFAAGFFMPSDSSAVDEPIPAPIPVPAPVIPAAPPV